MLKDMTETPEHPAVPTTAAAQPRPTEAPSQRDGRIYRLAAFVVLLAGIVFIVAVIFWRGFALGACVGGHHGHGGHHWSGMSHQTSEAGPVGD
jgi:hypothetical protein